MVDPADLGRALDKVGDRWSLQIVSALATGSHRFGELAEALAGIAPNILVKRLRQLEADGILTAAPYSRRPLRMRYELTPAGTELGDAIALLGAWGAKRDNGQRSTPEPSHERCGTPLEVRLWCPTCDQSVDRHMDQPELHWL